MKNVIQHMSGLFSAIRDDLDGCFKPGDESFAEYAFNRAGQGLDAANAALNPETVPFNRFQQVAFENYSDLLPASGPEEVPDCGDTLFQFLMIELSTNEDCDSASEAVKRLDNAIRDLLNVRTAMAQLGD